MKILKLKDQTPSLKEKRLILREKSLNLAKKLRKNGFSYSQIKNELKSKVGFTLSDSRLSVHLRNIKFSKEGKKRYVEKIRKIRKRAGRKGGRKNIKSGHIFKIQHLAIRACKENAMKRIPKSSKILSLSKVRIISHCLFDGCVMENEAKSFYVIAYHNKCARLIDQFRSDMNNVYDLKPTDIRERKGGFVIRYCCKAAVKDLLRYTLYKDGKEKIPDEIMNGSLEWKLAFLKCFWDDEGMVGFTDYTDRKGRRHVNRYVAAFLKNKNLLNQLKELHELIGIKAYIYKNKLIISNKKDLQTFAKLINFSPSLRVSYPKSKWNGKEKMGVLRLAIQSYKR